MEKVLRIAIVEDSRPYLQLLAVFLRDIAAEKGLAIETTLFDNPVDYKVNRAIFDVIVLDYVFRQYTYGSNGFYLAKFTKEQRNPKTKIIINSSYSPEEIGGMLKEFDQYIDGYSHKETNMEEPETGLLNIISRLMDDFMAGKF